MPIRLVLTRSLPALRFCANSISSWQRSAAMMGWVHTFSRSTSLPISISTFVAFFSISQSTVLVTAALTAASSLKGAALLAVEQAQHHDHAVPVAGLDHAVEARRPGRLDRAVGVKPQIFHGWFQE